MQYLLSIWTFMSFSLYKFEENIEMDFSNPNIIYGKVLINVKVISLIC